MAVARLGWPLPYMIGPLIASAALRFPGIVDGALPPWLVELSLLVCGASIGTRFGGIGWRFFVGTVAWTFAGTLVLMAACAETTYQDPAPTGGASAYGASATPPPPYPCKRSDYPAGAAGDTAYTKCVIQS